MPVIGFHQVGSRGIEAAWAGGVRGREVTDRFLPAVAQLLSSQGLFYLVTIAENDPGERRASRLPPAVLRGRVDSVVSPPAPHRGDRPRAGPQRPDGRGFPIDASGERATVCAAFSQELLILQSKTSGQMVVSQVVAD